MPNRFDVFGKDMVSTALEACGPVVTDVEVPADPRKVKSDKTSDSTLLAMMPAYPGELARLLIITEFSLFEAYVKAVLDEIVLFHGGRSAILDRVKRRATMTFKGLPSELGAAKRKLQESKKIGKADKYRSYTRKLANAGFRFPSDLLSVFGAHVLLEKVATSSKRGLLASEIPNILENALLFTMTSAEKTLYEKVRLIRNRLAHGGSPSLTLRDSLMDASKLKKMATRIDQHIAEHFMLIEEYS